MLRAISVIVALLLPTAVPVASAPGAVDPAYPCTAPELRSATVENSISVETLHRDNPTLTVTTIVKVPSSWSASSKLRADPYGQDFRDAAQCFLPMWRNDYRARAPLISESDGIITLDDTVSVSEDSFAWGDSGGGTSQIGFWNAWPSGESLRLTFDSVPLDTPATWTVNLDTGGLPVRTAVPPPLTDDGHGHLAWTHLSAGQAAGIDIGVTWPSALSVHRVLGRWPLKSVTEAVWSLSWLVLFVPPLFLIRRLRKRHSGDSLGEEGTRRIRILRLICVTAIVLNVLKPLDDLAFDTPGFGIFENWLVGLNYPDWVGTNARDTDIFIKLEWGMLLIVTGWLYLATWWRRTPRAALLIGVVAPALVGGLVVISTRWWSPTGAPMADFGTSDGSELGLSWHAAVTLGCVLAPMAVVVFCASAATIGLVVRMWSSRRRDVSGDGEPGKRAILLTHATALSTAVLTIAFNVDLSRSDWQHSSVLGNTAGIGQTNWVCWEMWGSSHGFVLELQNMLALIAVAGVIALIHSCRHKARGVFFPPGKPSFAAPALAFVFAAWAVGSSGSVSDLNLPLGFAVSYVLLRKVVMTRRLEVLEESIIHTEPGPPPAAGYLYRYQGSLLDAAARSEQLNRELTQLDRDAGTIDTVTAGVRREEITAELDSLSRHWERPVIGAQATAPTTTKPKSAWWWRKDSELPRPRDAISTTRSIDPGQTALGLGPAGDWWQNGVLALRISVIPILIATGFYYYWYWHGGGIWPFSYQFGVLDIVDQLIFIADEFVATPFVIGCLYPYLRGRTGPEKGALIGLVAAVSYFTDALPTYMLSGSRYSTAFRDGIIEIAFAVVVGFLIDGRTLRHHHRDLARVVAIYRLASVRVAAPYAITVLLAVVGIWQQAHVTDQISQQRDLLISNVLKDVRTQVGP